MEKNLKWNGRSYGGRFGNGVFAVLLRFGRMPAYVLMAFVALFFMLFRRRQCAASSEYLSARFGEKVGAVSWRAYRHLFSFGTAIIDKYAYFSGAKIEISDECGAEILESLSRGKGAVLVVSHIGGWAISGGRLAEYDCPTGVVGISAEHDYIEKMKNRRLVRKEPKMIARADDPFSMVAAMSLLRKNGIVAMHGDRYAGGKFARVQFLGRDVRLPVSAFALAAKTGAAVFNVFCVRTRSGGYKMTASRGLVIPNLRGAELDAALADAARAYAADIECVLREHPFEWFNFYPFWLQ